MLINISVFVYLILIKLVLNLIKNYRYENQNLSPLILLAKRMSLLIQVTRWAWYAHKLASSNKETIAASVAS